MLISINALFLPLVCLLVASVVWVALDRLLRRRIEEGRGRATIVRNAGIATLVSGLMVGISLLQAILEPARTALFTPYLMALGVLAATWCVRLRRLGLFWGTANYAQALGRRLAVNFEQGVQYMPRADVYSLKPRGIGSEAVKEVKVGSGDTAVYRCDGRRLLVLGGGRFFFLHDGWTPRGRNGDCAPGRQFGRDRVQEIVLGRA